MFNEKWDLRFLELVKHMSTWSKDESTKVGCAIVGSNKEILSCGYNGFARGVDDTIPSRSLRPEKYLWTEHAERNAIFNAARIGVCLQGSILYSTLCPCMDCARAVVQCGIVRVVTVKPNNDRIQEIWKEQLSRVEELFQECGVELAIYN